MSSGSLFARSLLAVGLFVGFYALALGVAAAIAWLPIAEILYANMIHPKLALICWVAAAVIVWSILPRFDRFEAPGPRLERADHPELFALVDDVARATAQAPPADVYLVHDVNAFVAERGGFAGIGRRRILGIGLPLLQVLTVPELRAVLAHEFGHYHGGDTALGPWIHRTRSAIGRTVVNLDGSGVGVLQLVSLPFQWYGKLFLRTTLAVSRAQEYAADALAARLEGAGPVRASLKRVHQASLVFAPYLDTELAPVLAAGFRPPFAAGFASFLVSPNVARVVQKHLDETVASGTHDPYDSHPCLRDRLAALDAHAEGPAQTDARPAITLLGDVAEAELAVLRRMLTTSPDRMQAIDWSEVGERVALPQAREMADAVRARFAGTPIADLPVGRAAFVELARAHLVARKQPPSAGVPEAALVGLGLQLTMSVVLARLAQEGWAVESKPGTAYAALRDGTRFEPAPTLAAALDAPAPVEAWRSAVGAAGIGALTI
jgi:Zn-dependent protease with chaperone function